MEDVETNNLLIESRNLRKKYNNKIPILLRSSTIKLEKYKYLVPEDITLSQFSFVLRKRTKLNPKEAIFYLIDNISHSGNKKMGELYSQHSNPDTELLIIDLYRENTFGN